MHNDVRVMLPTTIQHLKTEPLVSFIITTKNEERYIEKCLKSIRNQTHQNIEIILVDSSSEDKTVEIAEKYADAIVVKDCITPVGRNIGTKHVRGNILAFVDADVTLKEDWLEKVLSRLDGNTVAVAGDLFPENIHKAKNVLLYFLVRLSKTLAHASDYGNIGIGATAALVLRSTYQKVKGFTNRFTTADDLDFSMRIKRHGKIVFEHRAKATFSTRYFEKYGYLPRLVYWTKNFIDYVFRHKVVAEYRR